MFAEALHFHEQFCRRSDLEAAKRSIDVYGTLLANGAPRAAEAFGPVLKDYHILIQLASVLENRYRYARDDNDITSAVKYANEALTLCSAGNVICPTVTVRYAEILASQSGRTPEVEARQMAEAACRQAIDLCRPGHPLRTEIYGILGWTMHMRYLDTGNTDFIEQSLQLLQMALQEILPCQIHDKHRYLRYLSYAWLRRYQAFGELDDLNRSISSSTDVLDLCPTADIGRGPAIYHVMRVLRFRVYHSGELDDLNRAIDIGLQSADVHDSSMDYVRQELGTLLHLRHQLTLSDGSDIQLSVKFHRDCSERFMPGSMHYWVTLGSLAIALRSLFSWNGELGYLEEALDLSRQAAGNIPHGHTEWCVAAGSVATALALRYAEAGDSADLVEALDWDRRAMASIPVSSESYSRVALSTISLLCLRYETFQSPDGEDLEKAAMLSQELLSALPAGNANEPDVVHHLVKSLLLRGQHNNDVSDIQRVIDELEARMDVFAPRWNGAECLRILSAGHRTKFRWSLESDHADRALEIILKALSLVRPGQRERYQCLIDAATLYIEKGTQYRNPSLSLEYVANALSDDHRDVRSRLQGAIHVLNIFQEQHNDPFLAGDRVSTQLQCC
ncbi:hypothetical protein PUNSTDRAFT_138380 [Punctularia strigosozonata HHB-11173 SS5]|uniref:Uncharacterized protein n=1 Tax=Punctularia strigosozonata (strain HHB-11173) TaxID=741275 RepID=R7S5M5_PUNST|nr:uncharacterized protein PUNSTDRAFT_138380 [Punctularia strigosozonata HHB-11173 SS5]EIN04736.1 hypothetical protein PUNSTDRAFT_138380 [Punctularia strigosozonata HHB-11173 SS5]